MTTTLSGQFAQAKAPDKDRTGETLKTDFVVPTRISAGVGWVVTDDWVIVGDWIHVRYKQRVTDNFQVIDFQDSYKPENFYHDNTNELHTGAEYRFLRSGNRVMALRGGLFLDPHHSLRFRHLPGNPDDDDLIDARFNRNLEDKVGFSAGVGGAWKGRVQADLGLSYARDAFDLVVSAVLRLK